MHNMEEEFFSMPAAADLMSARTGLSEGGGSNHANLGCNRLADF
jgi:hypothetical protein